MSKFFRRLAKDEEAFYMVEYVILTSLVVVFLVGTIEFTVIGSDGNVMGTAMTGADNSVGVTSGEQKTIGKALAPVYRFIAAIMGLPIG